MDPLSLASLGIGGLGAIGGIINSFTSGNKLKKLYSQEPQYQVSPYASQRLSMAQNLLNARMPGATSMERNIYGNQANQLANVNRNATDSSQALALGSAAQGQTNQAFQNLGTQEQQDYYNRLQNLSGAQQGMIQEGDKVYQDQVRRFQDLAGITGANMQNRAGAFNSIANLGFGGANALSFLNMGKSNQNPNTSMFGAMNGGANGYAAGATGNNQGYLNPNPTSGGVQSPWANPSAWTPNF